MKTVKYINAEAVKSKVAVETKANKVLNNDSGFHSFLDGFKKLFDRAIDEMPAANVQEVRHGKWIYDEENECWYCSLCECSALNNYRGLSVDSDYCPHCGAIMDGE